MMTEVVTVVVFFFSRLEFDKLKHFDRSAIPIVK